jgi:hypothetical protein
MQARRLGLKSDVEIRRWYGGEELRDGLLRVRIVRSAWGRPLSEAASNLHADLRGQDDISYQDIYVWFQRPH